MEERPSQGCPIDLDKWLHKYDHFDPDYLTDPYPIFAALRKQCPVIRSELYGGFWVALNSADMELITHDPVTFSSRKVNIPHQWDFPMPPIKSDPPDHTAFRRMLLPAFSSKEVARWEAETWSIAEALVERFAGSTQIDGAQDYAREIPLSLTCKLLGIDESHRDVFAEWVRTMVDGGAEPESVMGTLQEMTVYLQGVVAQHREAPREDLTSFLVSMELEGRPLSDPEIVGAAWLILMAGIDTTWGATGSSLHHLANHPEDRRRLVEALDDPDSSLWDTAIEEFLRAFAPATMAREVMKDVDLQGQQLQVGDLILLPFPAANRDPAVFERPDEVLIDRQHNHHATFGIGIHRCLGLNFARMEMRVGLQTFLRRFPEFHIPPGANVRYGGGQVRGPRELPLVLEPVGGDAHQP